MARDLLLVKTRAARAVASTMTRPPTNTLVEAVCTQEAALRDPAAAAWRRRSLEAAREDRRLARASRRHTADTYTHMSRPGP